MEIRMPEKSKTERACFWISLIAFMAMGHLAGELWSADMPFEAMWLVVSMIVLLLSTMQENIESFKRGLHAGEQIVKRIYGNG